MSAQSSDARTYCPPGLIPEYNAWGNHPSDLMQHIEDNMPKAYRRMGVEARIPEGLELCRSAICDLAQRDNEFVGHYLPTPAMEALLHHSLDTYLDAKQVTENGFGNIAEACSLHADGNAVVVMPNHTSAFDATIPIRLIRDRLPGEQNLAIVISQVFFYARMTGLLTSGMEQFPLFQPKHIAAFAAKGCDEAVRTMTSQNITTIKAVKRFFDANPKMLFLYLERDRNIDGMGVPEPGAVKFLDIASRAAQKRGKSLYILPMNISGLSSVFPIRRGVNELDLFWEIIQRGGGHVNCAKPVKYEDVLRVSQNPELSDAIEGNVDLISSRSQTEEYIRSVAILSMIARLAPNDEAMGVYADRRLQNAIECI